MLSQHPSAEAMHPFRVFLVEDDDDHAELTTFHLQRHAPNAIIERAVDGEQAVARMLEFAHVPWQERPSVVLLDINLPKLDGIGVLERVREHEDLLTIPIIILSTSDSDNDRAKAYRRHANSYLVKPSEFGQFDGLMGDFVRYWRDRNARSRRDF